MNLSHRPHYKLQPKVLMLISSMLLHGTLLPNALNAVLQNTMEHIITTSIFTSLEKTGYIL